MKGHWASWRLKTSEEHPHHGESFDSLAKWPPSLLPLPFPFNQSMLPAATQLPGKRAKTCGNDSPTGSNRKIQLNSHSQHHCIYIYTMYIYIRIIYICRILYHCECFPFCAFCFSKPIPSDPGVSSTHLCRLCLATRWGRNPWATNFANLKRGTSHTSPFSEHKGIKPVEENIKL